MNRAYVCVWISIFGITSLGVADDVHDTGGGADRGRFIAVEPQPIPHAYVTHEKVEGNSEPSEAQIIIYCLPGKNDGALKKQTKAGDVVLKGMLPPRPTHAQAQAQAPAPEGGSVAQPRVGGMHMPANVNLVTFLSAHRDNQILSSGRREVTTAFFKELEPRVRTLEKKLSEALEAVCSAEDELAATILKGLSRRNAGRVLVEADCERWNSAPVLTQLVKPYRHVILKQKGI